MANKIAGYSKISTHRAKLRIIALFGGKCQQCGFADERALQIDHIKRAPSHTRGTYRRGGEGLWRGILKGILPIEDFQLLCANCNWIKRYTHDEFCHTPRRCDIPDSTRVGILLPQGEN